MTPTTAREPPAMTAAPAVVTGASGPGDHAAGHGYASTAVAGGADRWGHRADTGPRRDHATT
ncbi:hypothetical protein AB0H37_27825 [Actinomadura sp. NPDC023710]|uniref:hypothetical protein n=1 Tax=Actinomadura sp. NPDC023710 TaxID=3158219 RepID=UPI0033DF8AEF